MDISHSMLNYSLFLNKKKCHLEIHKTVSCETYEFLKPILFRCTASMACIYISIYFDVCAGGAMFTSIALLTNSTDDREKGS